MSGINCRGHFNFDIALCVESGIDPIEKLYERRHDGELILDTDSCSRATDPEGLVCVADMHSVSLALASGQKAMALWLGFGFFWLWLDAALAWPGI
jgi:hypothetical protein